MRTPERSVELTEVTEWDRGAVRSVQDSLAAEEPLEIRMGGRCAKTLAGTTQWTKLPGGRFSKTGCLYPGT